MTSRSIAAPTFLVGAERSGTTVLRLMLDHHPAVAFCYEFEYAVDRISDGRFPDVAGYCDWLETDRIFRGTGFVADRDLGYVELVDSFLRQKAQGSGKPVVGATVHRHFDRLLAIWPEARFIHILRDGRDVARSCIGMGWAGNVWTGVERWIEAECLWEELRRRLPDDRYVEVKYESLIEDTETTLRALSAFLGVPYDPAMLDYAESTTYDKPDARLIAQWKRKLSEQEIRLLESRIGGMLAARGYELSGLPPLRPGKAARWKLGLQDRVAVRRQRMRVYGVPLVVSGYVARRLGAESWQRRIQMRRNAIDDARIK